LIKISEVKENYLEMDERDAAGFWQLAAGLNPLF
jgi:hypothetical protein